MSGIVFIHHREGAPVTAAALEPALEALAHRGADGRDLCVEGGAGLAILHAWTTPEDIGVRQPLVSSDGRWWLAFDGRLDDRETLLAALGQDLARSPDAALVLAAFERWGESTFGRLLGPFAMVLWDRQSRSVTLARDPLGGRTLFVHRTPHRIMVASEERAVVALEGVPARLDPRRAAVYFALADPLDGASFFAEVEEILPGTWWRFDVRGEERRRFWSFDPRGQPAWIAAARHDAERVELFGETLRKSVACRLRGGPPALLLSGGLDSSSIAAFASHELAAEGRGPLQAVSWIFDELTECDERPWLDALAAHLEIRGEALESTRVAGDDAWPLSTASAGRSARHRTAWPINPNTPESNPFRRLFERAYGAAREGGARVLLNGGFGDPLYLGASRWHLERLDPRRPLASLGELAWHLRRQGPADLWRRGVRGALAERRHGPRRPSWPEWLTEEARSLLDEAPPPWPPESAACRRPRQARRLLGLLAARGATADLVHDCRLGLEVRSPFRDRRMIELALHLPAHLLFDRGLYKIVLRRAFEDRLPKEILERRHPTLLTPLYRRGLAEREKDSIRQLLERPERTWNRWVSEAWLRDALRGARHGRSEHVLWYALAWEIWFQSLAETGFSLGD